MICMAWTWIATAGASLRVGLEHAGAVLAALRHVKLRQVFCEDLGRAAASEGESRLGSGRLQAATSPTPAE